MVRRKDRLLVAQELSLEHNPLVLPCNSSLCSHSIPRLSGIISLILERERISVNDDSKTVGVRNWGLGGITAGGAQKALAWILP